MIGIASPLAEVRRCRGCKRPEGFEVLAWKSGRWCFLTGAAAYVFEPWGEQVEKPTELERTLDDPAWRVVNVKLTGDGLCARCAHTFPQRPRRAWKR